MADLAAPSEGLTQTPAAAPSTPSTPSGVFQDSNTPEWIKTAGLEEAHNKATPKSAATTPESAKGATPAAPAVPVPPAATPPVVPTPPQLAIDPKALAAAIREGNQPAPAGPSDEELSRQLGIVAVTPEMYKGVFGVDGTPDQIRGLNDYGQAIAKQAVTIAKVLFDRELSAMRESIQPYTKVVQQQEASRIKSEFFKTHADLAGYEELVTEQYQLAKAAGRTFASIDEAGKFVADQTRSRLKSLGITPTAPAVPNGSTQSPAKSTPQTRPMAPHAMGGKGGGTPSGDATPKSASAAVWG